MISARDNRIMSFLRRQAIDVKPVGSSRIAAAVTVKNDIISLGHCQRRTHPFQAKYSKNPEAIYLHAETNAIANALNHISRRELERATLYIRRVKLPQSGSENFIDGLSRPCAGCMRAIMSFNLKRVVYSTDCENEFAVLCQ